LRCESRDAQEKLVFSSGIVQGHWRTPQIARETRR
jgi:hypothetical protein